MDDKRKKIHRMMNAPTRKRMDYPSREIQTVSWEEYMDKSVYEKPDPAFAFDPKTGEFGVGRKVHDIVLRWRGPQKWKAIGMSPDQIKNKLGELEDRIVRGHIDRGRETVYFFPVKTRYGFRAPEPLVRNAVLQMIDAGGFEQALIEGRSAEAPYLDELAEHLIMEANKVRSRMSMRRILGEDDPMLSPTVDPETGAPVVSGTDSGDRLPMDSRMFELHPELRDWVPQIPRNFLDALRVPALARWAGFEHISELEFLGSGTMGYAWKLGDSVLKLSVDRHEAVTSTVLLGRDLDHVIEIYDVGEIAKVRPEPVYAIMQDYLPGDLSEEEETSIMRIFGSYAFFAQSNLDDPVYLNIQLARDEYLMSRMESTMHAFLDGIEQFEIWDEILEGLLELASLGIGYMDIHPGNVRKDASGRYVLFDIGRSVSETSPAVPLIEQYIPAQIPLIG